MKYYIPIYYRYNIHYTMRSIVRKFVKKLTPHWDQSRPGLVFILCSSEYRKVLGIIFNLYYEFGSNVLIIR